MRQILDWLIVGFNFVIVVITVIMGGVLFGMEKFQTSEYAALEEIKHTLVALPNTHTIKKDFDGKAVYVHGIIQSETPITDPHFGVVDHGLFLDCKVEYFQWEIDRRRHRKDYEENWVGKPSTEEELIEDNVLIATYRGYRRYAEGVHLDAYAIGHQLLDTIPDSTSRLHVQWTQKQIQDIEQAILEEARRTGVKSQSIYDYESIKSKGHDAFLVHVLNDDTLYLGIDPQNSRIGDMKISFITLPNKREVSFIARLKGNTLDLFSDKYGETATVMVQLGHLQIEDLIAELNPVGHNLVIRIILPFILCVCFLLLVPLMRKIFTKWKFLFKPAWIVGPALGLSISLILFVTAHLFILVPRFM